VLAVWAGVSVYRLARDPLPLWPLRAGGVQTWTELRSAISRSQLERLAFAIKVYYLAFGTAPDSLETLLDQGLLRRSDLVDPWSRPFAYRPLGAGFIISGRDANGEVDPEMTLTQPLQVSGTVAASNP